MNFLEEDLTDEEMRRVLADNDIEGVEDGDLPDNNVATLVAFLNDTAFGSCNDWEKHYRELTGERAQKEDRKTAILRCVYYSYHGSL